MYAHVLNKPPTLLGKEMFPGINLLNNNICNLIVMKNNSHDPKNQLSNAIMAHILPPWTRLYDKLFPP